MKQIFILLCTLFLLSACSLLSSVNVGPTNIYVINTAPQPVTKKPVRRINVLVPQPTTRSIYNTTEIAYTTRPYQIAYLAKSSWAESPIQMLQPLLIKTLQKTHYFHFVGAPAEVSQYDYVLNTQITKLELDYSHIPNSLHFSLNAQIIDASTNQVVASKEFNDTEYVQQNNPYAGIYAANRANAIVLRQLAYFCLKYMR